MVALLTLVTLILFYRKMDFSYWLLGILLLFIPLIGGPAAIPGMVRYVSVIFPLAVLFAKLGRNPRIDQMLTICFALLQGCLMTVWSSGLHWIV
jgi:hypothetical protein